jgi:ribosome biogenesis GTPase
VKAVGGVFTVYADKKYTCFAPKKIRYNEQDILVGDKVLFSVTAHTRGTIEEVLPRLNQLKRPEVANVDYLFILLAPEPAPELMLIDKIIVSALYAKVCPVLVINKADIASEEFVCNIRAEYSNVCDILVISTVTGSGVDTLLSYLYGKTVCLAGQSAVGKTSLLNFLLPTLNKEIGTLSAKSNRGTHTTRYSQIYETHDGFIVDTTGFSLLLFDYEIDSKQLMLYYDDMQQLATSCKYKMCTHTVEPNCGVKQAVDVGTYPRGRYDRYVAFYNELVLFEKEKYR